MILFAALILAISIPVYYFILNKLWRYELDEHHITLSTEAGREDRYLIISIITGLTVLFFVLLLIGFIILNRRMSRKLWQPFYKSLEDIRHFELHRQQPIQWEQTDIQEFNDLNESLQKLIDGNIEIYRQQKEFADNASHELQTPLAIVQTKLELLLQNKSLTADQYNLIGDIQNALSRVGRINKNLLLLAKIENSQFMDQETLNMSEIVHQSISDFEGFAAEKGLTIVAEVDEDAWISGNKILVEILVNNLLTNAIRHASGSGNLTVTLGKTSFKLSNPGTNSLASNQLFKRFTQASAQAQGTGLGLALVDQIAKRYGWQVEYEFTRGNHQFKVIF